MMKYLACYTKKSPNFVPIQEPMNSFIVLPRTLNGMVLRTLNSTYVLRPFYSMQALVHNTLWDILVF